LGQALRGACKQGGMSATAGACHTADTDPRPRCCYACRTTASCTNPTPCPVNCVASWSNWTSCTAACAGGNQTSIYTITTPANFGGTPCEAANSTSRSQACNTQPCPEDCWGEWGNWTDCSAACGTGYRTAIFSVTKAAAFGGQECEAANNIVRNGTCNEQPCPVACVGDWGTWSLCDASCGGGSQNSTFAVTTPDMYGGAPCGVANDTVRTQACNTHNCPVDCVGEMTVILSAV
jgi:hypothetical protein